MKRASLEEVRYVAVSRDQPKFRVSTTDELVSADHPVRGIWALASRMDWPSYATGTHADARDPGRAALPPALLGALWLYGSLRGIGSARELSRRCESDGPFRWLCGDKIEEVSHETLRKFRLSASEDLLAATLGELGALGLLSERSLSVAVDGTKVRGAASRGSFLARAEFEERMREKLRSLRGKLDAAATSRERGSLRGEMAEVERLAEAGAESLRRREEAQAASHDRKRRERTVKVSATDPECNLMRHADGGTSAGWNVQAAVDADSGAVLAVEVTDKQNDQGLAGWMALAVMKKTGTPVRRVLADAGYPTRADEARLAGMGVKLYAPSPRSHAGSEWAAARLRRMGRLGSWAMARRKRAEHFFARLKNRGGGRVWVRGRDGVRGVMLLHAAAANAELLLRAGLGG